MTVVTKSQPAPLRKWKVALGATAFQVEKLALQNLAKFQEERGCRLERPSLQGRAGEREFVRHTRGDRGEDFVLAHLPETQTRLGRAPAKDLFVE